MLSGTTVGWHGGDPFLIMLSLAAVIYAFYLGWHLSGERYRNHIPTVLMIVCLPGVMFVIAKHYWYFIVQAITILVMKYMLSEDEKMLEQVEEARKQRVEAWQKECEQSIGGTDLDRFYVECVLARCTDFSLPKNAEKAKLLAQKYRQYPPCTTEELFLEAREKHGTIANDLQKERLAKLREQENRAYRESIQYAGYQGKEKMRIMLTHSIQEHRRKIDQIVNKAASETPTLEKEHNWGVWGGIADGLAGPAAGVSTALNVQSQNAQIRERNNARLNATLGLYTLAVMDAGQIKREADYEQKVRDDLPEKLLDDKTDPKDIFKQMQIIDSNVEVSETGAFRVTASIHSRSTPKIFGDVSARIDGTILAHVYEDDRLVGTAKMVLPKLGITNKWEPIMGICLNGADLRKKQTVKFEAGNLWMIEY